MAEKESKKKWLVLLVILVALSLVVDLLSLNVLYDLSGEGNLEGELAEIRPAALDCINDNCDTIEDCRLKAAYVSDVCIREYCQNLDPKSIYEYFAYYDCHDDCQMERNYEFDSCVSKAGDCILDCLDKFPQVPLKRIGSPTSYYA